MLDNLKLPGIVSDIDGVLVKQKTPIPRGASGIRFLKTPLKNIDPTKFSGIDEPLPFVCLTNSGTGTERQKADALCKILGLNESEEQLEAKDIIMNYTPIKSIIQGYKDRLVMLGGLGPIHDLAEDFGLTNYITDEEYCNAFPLLVPYATSPLGGEDLTTLRKKIAVRLGITDMSAFDEPFQVHAIFMLNDPIRWDERVQVICDLLSTNNGTIAKILPAVGPEDHIPVYCTNDDMLFAGEFRLPRMTFGCFNETLKRIYKFIYKRDLNLIMYGKPQQATYDFAKKYLQEKTKFQISNMYMIGDNPKSDIRGGNAAGWTTILVKTGVFRLAEDHTNDEDDPATYVVEDFVEALKLICKLEGIEVTDENFVDHTKEFVV